MSYKNNVKVIASIPVLGYILRTIYSIVRLPKIYDSLSNRQEQVSEKVSTSLTQIGELDQKETDLASKLSALQLVQDNLQQHMSTLETQAQAKPSVKSASSSPKEQLFAEDHLLDKFYTAFEDKFRGDETVIVDRQKEYLPYFTKTKLDFKKTPVLDIGSGRGEFLQLLQHSKITGLGLDINHDMVARSKQKGLEAIQGDALAHLKSVKPRQYGAITGFHIVEHIPFHILLRIFSEARRALAQDGFVLFETPNPENLVVGSTTFYLDPSHLHPVPPMLLAFTLEFSGFRNVEIIRLHPSEKLQKPGLTPDARDLLYGPRDYAVIGYK